MRKVSVLAGLSPNKSKVRAKGMPFFGKYKNISRSAVDILEDLGQYQNDVEILSEQLKKIEDKLNYFWGERYNKLTVELIPPSIFRDSPSYFRRNELAVVVRVGPYADHSIDIKEIINTIGEKKILTTVNNFLDYETDNRIVIFKSMGLMFLY